MPNSRSMYMEKCFLDLVVNDDVTIDGVDGFNPGANVTFTPPFGAHTWQLRFITNADAHLQIAVQTIDEDGDLVHIDDSPFLLDTAGTFDANGELEVTLDSTNPSVKVTLSEEGVGAGTEATATVKCKAYRTLEDVSAGSYTQITPRA